MGSWLIFFFLILTLNIYNNYIITAWCYYNNNYKIKEKGIIQVGVIPENILQIIDSNLGYIKVIRSRKEYFNQNMFCFQSLIVHLYLRFPTSLTKLDFKVTFPFLLFSTINHHQYFIQLIKATVVYHFQKP